MNSFERYHKAIAYLEGLPNLPLKGDYMIDTRHANIYLNRTRYFLNLLWNPDKGLKYIHIAGTSGKGTVTNMLHEILRASGKKVGSFTSPFSVTSIEKIKVGDKYISPGEFADIVEHLKPFIDESYAKGPYGRVSYFEIFFAIALIYFKNRKCEWVVLEVGLGGRYDATNVIKSPVVTAITNIDYDHTDLLGKTLEKIAYDKAGIIKTGSEFFTSEQRKPILQVFKDICEEKHVAFHHIPHQNDHVAYNKELAAAIACHLNIDDKHIAKGEKSARLPCRFEKVQGKPIVIIDGAHNRAKMRATIDNLQKIRRRKTHLVIGIADNKNHLSILKQIIPLADKISFTRFQNKDRKCAHPKALLAKSGRYFKAGFKEKSDARIYLDSEQALSNALEMARPNDMILVTGSFFLAGELRKRWYPEEWILKHRRSF